MKLQFSFAAVACLFMAATAEPLTPVEQSQATSFLRFKRSPRLVEGKDFGNNQFKGCWGDRLREFVLKACVENNSKFYAQQRGETGGSCTLWEEAREDNGEFDEEASGACNVYEKCCKTSRGCNKFDLQAD